MTFWVYRTYFNYVQLTFIIKLIKVNSFHYSVLQRCTNLFVKINWYAFDFTNTLISPKLSIFILCQKSLDIKIMFHEDISYRKYIKT